MPFRCLFTESRPRAAVLGALASLAIAACGQVVTPSTVEPDGGALFSDAPVAPDKIAEVLVAARCASIARCDVMHQYADLSTTAALLSEAACRAEPGREAYYRPLVEAVRAGRVRFDGAVLRRCIARHLTTCEAFDPFSCAEAFDGSLAPGATCQVDAECGREGYCSNRDDAVPRCAGVCLRRPRIGELCPSLGTPCVGQETDAVRCTFGDGIRCRREVVRPSVPEGGACGRHVEAAVDWSVCAPGLGCVAGADRVDAGRCQSLPEAGQPCLRTLNGPFCASGLACVGDRLSGERTCVEIVVRQNEGEPCAPQAKVFCDPARRLDCREGRCVRIGDGGVGAACDAVQWGPLGGYCDPGLACIRGRCGRVLTDGSPCASAEECTSGNCRSNGDAQVCAPPACAAP
jgi:hypothetical protein